MDRHTRSVGAKVLRAVCTPRGTGLHQHTHPCTSRQLCTHENRRALIKCVSVKRCVSPGSVTHTHGCDICTQDTRTHPGRGIPSEMCNIQGESWVHAGLGG